ncbi:HAD-IA family hydrolase [Ornithinimicrobium sufpigmenti]|uniref:HAD-IA family hydrolase n=1 Tax=Ornithinimicrobium sufpigmenti TaxID=2508882 RepID=UPI001EDEE2E3|nr:MULTISPECIES: HAD-IA family hydrolase [unclassified Ornithinimicrobium]
MRDIWGETFDAVLFDNDGTLIDSSGPVLRSWTAWARHHGIPAAAFGNVHGMPSRQVVQLVAPHLDVDEATAHIDRIELGDVDGVRALPGAAQALSATSHRSAIVTSAGRELLGLRLAQAGLSAPAVVVTAEDISRGKPDPEPYLTGARLLGVDPARCLVVEDAPAGLRAGRAAGAATLAVTTTGSAEEVSPFADVVVADLSQVRLTADAEGIRLSRP